MAQFVHDVDAEYGGHVGRVAPSAHQCAECQWPVRDGELQAYRYRREPAGESAHPHAQQGEGTHTDRRQGAGDLEFQHAEHQRSVVYANDSVPRCRHQARSGTAGLSGWRRRYQTESRSQQHHENDSEWQLADGPELARLPDRDTQRVDEPAPEGWREPDSWRPDLG